MYHLSVKAHSRSNGASATAAAAYRSGQSITDERTGQRHDYTRRAGVVSTGIIGWHGTRESLWNAAEAAEKRSNSTVAREYEVALPADTTDADRQSMVQRFAGWLADRYGVAVDYAIHRPHRTGDKRNHHAHILTTTRQVTDGQLAAKTRILDCKQTGAAEVEAIRAEWGAGFVGWITGATRPEGLRGYQANTRARDPPTHGGARVGFRGIAAENQRIESVNRELERMEAMQQDLERAAAIEEETIRRLRKEWEEEKAREAREAAWEAQNKRKAMLHACIDYINILGAARHSPQLKEILRQHEAAKRMKDWDSAATILIEFWQTKLDQYGDMTAPEIARADIKAAAAAQPRTSYAEDAIRSIQDPQPYPAGYRTASEIKAAKEAARRRGGIGGR